MKHNRLSIISTLVNGLLTLTILLVLMMNVGKTPPEILTNYSWVIFIAVIISLVAAWRSYADMGRLLAGKKNWLRPAFEGFMLGFFPLPISHIIGMVSEAFAAGPPWPSFGYSSLEVWFQYLFWLIKFSAILGVMGAFYAILLSWINRIILRILSDNNALQGKSRAGRA